MILRARHLAAAFAGLLMAAPATGQGRTELRFVAGVPVIRTTLRAGDRAYPCHLLLDLSRNAPLILHRNAASALRAERVDVESGELTLRGLPVLADRDQWLEKFTATYATELREVPLVGRLGLPAFGARALVIDGPGQRFEVLPEGQAGPRPPAVDGRRGVVDLAANPLDEGVQVPVELGQGLRGRLFLHSADPASYIDPNRAERAGWAGGRLASVRVGGLELADQVAFRPDAPPGGRLGTIGGRLLARLHVTLHLGDGWVALELAAQPLPWPEDEGRFYAARYAAEPIPALQTFLAGAGPGPFRIEAADALLEFTLAAGTDRADPELLESACLQRIAAANDDARASEALRLLPRLPDAEAWWPLREKIARQALAVAESDTDGNASHKLRVELGRIAHGRGDFPTARRHLLSAVFGMPTDGPANMALGRLYEDKGQFERARGRYFLALLDMKRTGADGLLALTRVHRRSGATSSVIEVLEEMADGRLPALYPIPREPEEIQPTGRVLLVELFTGAQCEPCAAADVAFDAVGEYFGNDEIARIQWHLPVPAAEPLVSGAALQRARQLGYRSTPTCVVAGEPVVGGGRPEDAPAMFNRYREILESALEEAPVATIEAQAARQGRQVTVKAVLQSERTDLRLHAVLIEDKVVYPGRNGILFHRNVARARLSPAAGVPGDRCTADAPWLGRKDLDELAASLDALVATMETERRFRVRPTTPDPDRLSVVLFATDGDGRTVQALTVPVTES